MKNSFFIEQPDNERKLYIDLLEIIGSLSNLFSESKKPFLYYRAMENIFCKSFKARNLSRSDISADASKFDVGIGLKTFLQNNGKTFQKVAEFNRESYLLKGLENLSLIKEVSNMRNERIKSTMRICKLKDMMYHVVTRSENYMSIYEEHMDLVNVKNINITGATKTTIHFNDGLHDYNFNLSKSTLLKRFDTDVKNKICGFKVEILEDPYEFLLSVKSQYLAGINNNEVSDNSKKEDFIILPLYSPRSGKIEDRSGLNQWNAKGRKRDENEVYIPIPSWIHNVKQGFFIYNTKDRKTAPFKVKLPNGKILSMKVAQQGGKALMSNPNFELGKWILREILQLKPKEVVTKKDLDIIGIDSVKLTKSERDLYELDFLKTGSYEEFKQKYKK